MATPADLLAALARIQASLLTEMIRSLRRGRTARPSLTTFSVRRYSVGHVDASRNPPARGRLAPGPHVEHVEHDFVLDQVL